MMTTPVVAGFPITGDVNLRKNGIHEGIAYQVTNHGRDENGHRGAAGTWCYYVIVTEAQLSPEDFEQFWLEPKNTPHASGWARISYSYWDAPFANAEWHGGITFYEKCAGIDGEQRAVKMGCDFAHSWDEGMSFDLASVEREAVATVKALQSMYAFKRRCPYYGTYHDPAEMIAHGAHGALYSQAGFDKINDRAKVPA